MENITYTNETASVMLGNGKSLIVDKEYDWVLKDYHWFSRTWNSGNYTEDRIEGYKHGDWRKHITPHRVIFSNIHPGMVVDHINHNRYDNTLDNLRICTRQNNQQNIKKQNKSQTGFKGVKYDPRYIKKYMARIYCSGKSISIGRFDTPEKAARAYDEKARELFGEFAYTNSQSALL